MPIEMCSVLVVTLSVLCQLHANHQKLVQQATLANAIFDATTTAAMSKPNTSHCMSPSHLLCVFSIERAAESFISSRHHCCKSFR